MRYFIDYVEDRVSVDVHAVDDNTLIKWFIYRTESHTEAERSVPDPFSRITEGRNVFKNVRVSAVACPGRDLWMSLNKFSLDR